MNNATPEMPFAVSYFDDPVAAREWLLSKV